MITSRQARQLTEESERFIQDNLAQIERDIRAMSINGMTKTNFVVRGEIELARRLADKLVEAGYTATVRTEFGLLYEHRIDISW